MPPVNPREGDDRSTWRLDLAYEGTAYHGWARQPNHATVQQALEDTLAMVLREPVRLSVAGRTDAGVHAWAQVASFDCRRRDVRPARLRHALNALLPADLAVLAVSPAAPDFVAREARSRAYEYRLWTAPVKPVQQRAYVWDVRGRVEIELLIEAAKLLPGHGDFAALTPSAHLYRSCVREVLSAAWRANGNDEHIFEIRAGSFLHNMVRVAVGSMVDVAQGRMTLAEFRGGLESRERRRMGQTAPARGLALIDVRY
jgi:tRNA pseudouridine38-40 synthase